MIKTMLNDIAKALNESIELWSKPYVLKWCTIDECDLDPNEFNFKDISELKGFLEKQFKPQFVLEYEEDWKRMIGVVAENLMDQRDWEGITVGVESGCDYLGEIITSKKQFEEFRKIVPVSEDEFYKGDVEGFNGENFGKIYPSISMIVSLA